MATRTRSTKQDLPRRPPATSRAAPRAPSADASDEGESSLVSLARQVRSWADSVLGIAGAAADASLSVAKSMLPKAQQRAALERAGALVRTMRQGAGLTVDEVGHALNLKDPTLLELVENGKVALPFEIILRLASVLGRNDPISFVMRLTRSYNPDVWKTLESLGVGRLVVQAGREREFANIYRAHDEARRLSDEEFARVLAFTNSAFELALAFRRGADAPSSTRAHPERVPRKRRRAG